MAADLERRPVVLSDKEEELYRLAFSSIDKREFLRLASLAQWLDCSPGEVILKRASMCQTQLSLFLGKSKPFSATRQEWRFAPVSSLAT